MAKEKETLREVSIVPMFVQKMSPHPGAKGFLTTWMWKVAAITSFLLPSLHMLPEILLLRFSHFSMFLAADIQKSWTNGCGKHTNWLHSDRAGSTHGAAAAARSVSICTAHVHQGSGTAWLLGCDMEPGHPAAPLEQVEMGVVTRRSVLEQSWISGGKGLRLLCGAAGSLGQGGPS